MNEIWTLVIKTSLPKVCESSKDFKTIIENYYNFESAKNAMRLKIKEYAFSKNAMFNGKGIIKHFDKYIKDMYDPDSEDEEAPDNLFSKKLAKNIQEKLKQAFNGEDVNLDIKNRHYLDGLVGLYVKNNSIRIEGEDDGPINGIVPIIDTNIFSMEKEQDYYLYLEDMFGQDNASAELYIDLKKTTIE